MVSTATGGAALAIGSWYQSLGAAAALTKQWDFRKGVSPNLYGEATGLYSSEPLKLLLEYFDMDSALSDDSGKWFVQFKVTGQRSPRAFGKDEVRDVFRNATYAMLGHQTSSIEPIAGFIVATNRPVGMFRLIAEVAKRCRAKSDDDDPFLTFSESIAPDELFSTDSTNSGKSGSKKRKSTKTKNAKAPKTMRALARSATFS